VLRTIEHTTTRVLVALLGAYDDVVRHYEELVPELDYLAFRVATGSPSSRELDYEHGARGALGGPRRSR